MGHLTMHVLENRLDTANAARTRGELDAVIADLPPDRTAAAAALTTNGRVLPRVRPGRHGALWAPWMLTGALCRLIWVITSVAHGYPLYCWPLWVIGPWGAVLIAQAALARAGGRSGRRSSRAALAAESW